MLAFILAFIFPVIGSFVEFLFYTFLVFALSDILILFQINKPVQANRSVPKRLSNGDSNNVTLRITNASPFLLHLEIIDELPDQFQVRDFCINTLLKAGSSTENTYSLRPTQRGEYHFGDINIFINTRAGLFQRKLIIEASKTVAVYPSFIQMRKFELIAISDRLSQIGLKKIRRIGHSMEFDQIKEYVVGDDVRSINWKATARTGGELMVNHYRDERAQNIINVIDTGRVMKMPFEGMHLLDYAINSSLVLSNISILKDDRAGLLHFGTDKYTFVQPDRKRTHIQTIQENLYKLQTDFKESDFEQAVIALRKHLNQRSLVILYTNFEAYSSMERHLKELRMISANHLLLVVFFKNTELVKATDTQDRDKLDKIYTSAIAEKFLFEKNQIVTALKNRGIHCLYTEPEHVTTNTLNKYLEFKARGMI